MCVCVHPYICAYVGARWSPGVSSSITVHIMSLRHSPSLNLELTILCRLASRQALAICLPACSQEHSGDRHLWPRLFFHGGTGGLNSGPPCLHSKSASPRVITNTLNVPIVNLFSSCIVFDSFFQLLAVACFYTCLSSLQVVLRLCVENYMTTDAHILSSKVWGLGGTQTCSFSGSIPMKHICTPFCQITFKNIYIFRFNL